MNDEPQNCDAPARQSPDEARSTLGSKLRELRQKTGISVEDLAEITRISPRYIKAIEEGDLASLPGEIFGRGFIRNLCQPLGADPKPLLELFAAALRVAPPEEGPNQAPSAKPNAVPESEKTTRKLLRKFVPSNKRMLSVGLGVMLLTLASVEVYRSNVFRSKSALVTKKADLASPVQQPAAEGPPPANIGPTAKTASLLEVVHLAESAPVVVEVSETNAPIAAAVSAQEPAVSEQVLQLNVKEPVRIRLKVDKSQTVTRDLVPDQHEFPFQDSAKLLIFDASRVEVQFNGKPLGNLGGSGRIRSLSFTREVLPPPAL